MSKTKLVKEFEKMNNLFVRYTSDSEFYVSTDNAIKRKYLCLRHSNFNKNFLLNTKELYSITEKHKIDVTKRIRLKPNADGNLFLMPGNILVIEPKIDTSSLSENQQQLMTTIFKVNNVTELDKLLCAENISIFNQYNEDPVDIEKAILEREGLSDTEKESVVKTRIGQGRFRDSLIKKWRGKCSITGCDLTEILVASHIKPWNVCNNKERMDVNNGLLLTPSLDKLFDNGYITFDKEGKIVVSSQLNNAQEKLLGISREFRVTIDEYLVRFFDYHRNNIFRA